MPEIFQLTGYKNSLVQRILGTIRVDICIIKWIRVCDTPCKPSIGYSHVEMDIWNRNISGTTKINIYSIHLIHLFSWVLLLHFCNFLLKKGTRLCPSYRWSRRLCCQWKRWNTCDTGEIFVSKQTPLETSRG